MYYNEPEFQEKVRKSWKILDAVLARTTEPCRILHLSPFEGVNYDCLSLLVGEESHRSIMLNRNGVNGLVSGQLYEDLWNKFDQIGPDAMAKEIVELAKIKTDGVIALPTANSRVISKFINEWIDQNLEHNFYVGPINWPGSPKKQLEVPRTQYGESEWPFGSGSIEIALGLFGAEVNRVDQVSLALHLEKDGTVVSEFLKTQVTDEKYFAYIYRDPKTLKVRYAGYGTAPGRAYSVSHNDKIADEVENGEGFEILIAGPYRDEEEARNVESALVSAYSPEFNQMQQPGNRFRHLGVPNELGVRRTLPRLNVHDVGRITGGALIVLCNLTTQLMSGAAKVGPTNFTDDVVFSNIQDHWMVKKFMPDWIENPHNSPKVLVAVQGPVKDRMIIGASAIAINGWSTTPTAPWDKHLHTIPLMKESGLDVNELRGRQIDVKFGSGPPNYIMWIDGSGLVRHGYMIKGTNDTD